MRMADDRNETFGGSGPDTQRTAGKRGQVGPRLIWRKLRHHRLVLPDCHGKERSSGRVDQAEARTAILDQSDIDGEVAAFLDEFLGAVERIDEKEAGAEIELFSQARLLRHHSHIGSESVESAENDRLRVMV